MSYRRPPSSVGESRRTSRTSMRETATPAISGPSSKRRRFEVLRDAIGEHFGLRSAHLQGRPVWLRRHDGRDVGAAGLRRGRQCESAHGLQRPTAAPRLTGSSRCRLRSARRRRLLELPCTTGFTGVARGARPGVASGRVGVLAEAVPSRRHLVSKRHAQQDHADAGGEHARARCARSPTRSSPMASGRLR